MTSEAITGGLSPTIRLNIEPSSPLSSPPPSPPLKRSASPPGNDSLPDTESKMSNLGLDGSNDTPAKKRTKLTAVEKAEREKEKEDRRKEKEEKEKEKARLKAEREEQKKQREEEKARKEAEKAAEKAKRDEEKAKREEEKAKREEERANEKAKKEEEKAKKEENRAKKDRAQLRMDSFFARKAPSASVPETPASTIKAPKTNAPLLVASSISTDSHTSSATVAPPSDTGDIEMTGASAPGSDYYKAFQPFFVRPGVKVAPQNHFERDDSASAHACQQLDKCLTKGGDEFADRMDVDSYVSQLDQPTASYFQDIFALPPAKRQRRGNLPKYSTKQILAGLNSSPGPTPGIQEKKEKDQLDFVSLLKRLPCKILKYGEDVRPAYRGTFSRIPISSGLRKGRNPFQRGLPGIDYDYDSEAEWVEGPEDEGEELLSEDEEDPLDIGSADEMDDFLDDEGDFIKKKKPSSAVPVIPFSSGLMWEGEHPKSEEWQQLKMGFLLDGCSAPIDPFSQVYWKKSNRKMNPPPNGKQVPLASNSSPNGPILQSVSSSGADASSGSTNDAVSLGRYAQNISKNGKAVTCVHPNSTHFGESIFPAGPSRPYSMLIQNPEAKAKVSEIEKERGVLPLSTLVNESTAFDLGIPPQEHYHFFRFWHNLDSVDMWKYDDFVKAFELIMQHKDMTKVVVIDLLKKQCSFTNKATLKILVESYFRRHGSGNAKQWVCVFKRNEHGYWILDPEISNLYPPEPAPASTSKQAMDTTV